MLGLPSLLGRRVRPVLGASVIELVGLSGEVSGGRRAHYTFRSMTPVASAQLPFHSPGILCPPRNGWTAASRSRRLLPHFVHMREGRGGEAASEGRGLFAGKKASPNSSSLPFSAAGAGEIAGLRPSCPPRPVPPLRHTASDVFWHPTPTPGGSTSRPSPG